MNHKKSLTFIYGGSGSPIGLQYRLSSYAEDFFDTFYFVKNMQGDIVAIYNESGTVIGSYVYDAWGNFTTTVSSGVTSTESSIVTSYNPFRYRGYYYDVNASMYYLQSRYYVPSWGRFLNADGAVNANGDLIGFNMYAYCSNNPVMYPDPTGEVIISALLIGAGIGFVIGFTGSVLGQYLSSDAENVEIKYTQAVYDGIWGAINGALAATGLSTPISIGLGALSGGLSSIGNDILFGSTELTTKDIAINALKSTIIGVIGGVIAGGGSEKTIAKYIHSNDILNKTIANGTVRAIDQQFQVMAKHATSLMVSGVRYYIGNFGGLLVSKAMG